MCQLLGMNCNVPTDIVFSFTGFVMRGGHTDSELAFCFILQQLRARFGDVAPALPQLRATLTELVEAIAAFGTFNLMLSDGTALFAHCSTRLCYLVRQYPFLTAQLADE